MLRLLILILPLFAQFWDDTPVMKAMRSHVAEITLSQNEGRAPGSEGEAAVAAYVWEQLSSKGVDMLCTAGGDVFGVGRPEKGDTLTSRNIMGMVEGYDALLKGHFIVVAARMDNLGTNTLMVDGVPAQQIYCGANGNASGLAVMLELADKVVKNSVMFKRSVIFLGLGSSTASFAGAWHFLHHTFKKDIGRIDAMIDLDMIGMSKNGLMAFTAGNGDMNNILAKEASALQPVKPALISKEPYPSDYQVFYASEIPSVMFTTGRYSEHNTPRDTPELLDYDFMERTSEYLFNFTRTLANGPAGVPAFRNVETEVKGDDGNIRSWADCDVPPKFYNNANPSVFMQRWVYQYLKYPEACIRDGVQGRVMVEFVIGKDGNLRDARVVRSVDPQLDEAALKVVNASPKWSPAKVNGRKVDCKMTIPVEFRLKKRKNR